MRNVNNKLEKENLHREFIIKIAKMYYDDDKSQMQIAEEVGISRSNVSRILKISREMKIVDIRINDVSVRTFDIGESLKKKFNLREVVISPSNNDRDINISNIGVSAAKYLESIMIDNMKIGVAWGSSIYYMIYSLTPILKTNIEIVQLMGGTNWSNSYKYGIQLIMNLTEKIGGSARFMNAPLVLRSKKMRDLLMEEKPLKAHMDIVRNVDVAIVGIGTNDPTYSTMVNSNSIKEEELRCIWNAGIKAHICGRHIDMYGKPADVEMNDRIIGIELEDLKHIRNVIGIAGGKRKVEPIVACLRGGYIDTLVTDEKTAILVDKITNINPIKNLK